MANKIPCAMIVEDDVPAREAIAGYLCAQGWQVVELGSYEEAIESIRAARPNSIQTHLMRSQDGAEIEIAFPDVILADYEIFHRAEEGNPEQERMNAATFLERHNRCNIPVVGISRAPEFNKKMEGLGKRATHGSMDKNQLVDAIRSNNQAVLNNFLELMPIPAQHIR